MDATKTGLAAATELACGLPLAAVGMGFGRWSLQHPHAILLLFPTLIGTAWALGLWRGGRSRLPRAAVVFLAGLPLALAILPVVSARNPLVPLLPAVAYAFLADGAWSAARGRAGRRLAPLAGAALAAVAALLSPLFVPAFVASFLEVERVNADVPPFTLPLLDGGMLATGDLRGTVVVIDFWATWCIPCRRELPELEAVRRRFADRSDLAFFAVDLAHGDTPDQPGDSPEQARAFLRAQGLGLRGAYDADGAAQRALGPHRLPALFVLDRAGRLRWRHLGFAGAENLERSLSRVLVELLAEPRTVR